MSYNIRAFRHPIIVEQAQKSQDDRGACDTVWAPFVSTYAQIIPKSYSTQRTQATGIDFTVAYEITIRYNSRFEMDASKYRIRYKDSLLLLYSILIEDERNRFIKIIAYQQV